MSSGASRSRKRKADPSLPPAPEVEGETMSVEETTEDLVSQQERERLSKKPKLDVDNAETKKDGNDDAAEPPAEAESNPHLAEFREHAVSELKTMLARLMAERELALKEYLLLKMGGSLGCFDPSDPAIVKLTQEYHERYPLNLDAEDGDDELAKFPEPTLTTRTELFRPALFQAAGISLPSSAVYKAPNQTPTSSSPVPKSPAGGASADGSSGTGAASSRGPKSSSSSSSKARGATRTIKVKDEMMPDLADATPTNLTHAAAMAASGATPSAVIGSSSTSSVIFSSSSAPSKPKTPSSAKRAQNTSNSSSSTPRSSNKLNSSGMPTSTPSNASNAHDPSLLGSPLSQPMMNSDHTLLGWLTYLPFLAKGTSHVTSKRKAGFPWSDADLFSTTASVFDVPTPMIVPEASASSSSSSSSSNAAATPTTNANLLAIVPQPAAEVAKMVESWKERAHQDAEWLERISLLQREGKLSSKRMEPVPEPPRDKTHWDYVLKEMAWAAEDAKHHRPWRMELAKKLARAAEKSHVEKARLVVRAQRDREKALRDKARWIARQVTSFWHDIEQLIVYKHRSSLDKHKKAAMDKNLDFFVKQTEQYSASLAIDLQSSTAVPAPGSSSTPPAAPSESDIKSTTPAPTTDAPTTNAMDISTTSKPADDGKDLDLPDDEDFMLVDEEDDEATITGKEAAEADEETAAQVRETGHADEAAMLAAESELPIEEIMKRYGKDEGVSTMEVDGEDAEEGEEAGEENDEAASTADASTRRDDSGSEDGDDDNASIDSETNRADEQDRAKFGADFFARVAAHDPVATEQQHQSDKERLQAAAAEAQTLQPTGFTLATSSVKTAVPFLLQGTLREYQHIGLDWMVTMYEKRLNGILADEMGLGKTIMTISLLAHLACTGHWGPHLIVVPTSVLLNWEMELKRWCPQLKVLTYFGTPRQRKQKRTGWTKPNAFHVCLTSYKLVLQDAQAFKRMKWFYLILDEAHNIKNYKSQSWQTLLNFRTRRRLLLTGTPLQNNLMELWALMHFLMPHIFQSHKEFKDWFSNPVNSMIEGTSNYSEDLIRRLHSILRPFMLRRLKKDVEKQLPGKFEHIVMCKLSKRQRLLYDEYMATGTVQSTLKGGNYLGVANVLMQLRKVCNHPDLFEGRPIVSPFDAPGLTFDAPSPIFHIANASNDPFHATSLLIGGAAEPGHSAIAFEDAQLATSEQLTTRQYPSVKPRSLVADVIALKQGSLRVGQLPPMFPFPVKTFEPHSGLVAPIHISKSSAATPTFLAHLALTAEATSVSHKKSGSSSTTSSASSSAASAGVVAPTTVAGQSMYLPTSSTTNEFLMSGAAKSRLTVLGAMNASQVEKRIAEAQQRLSHFQYINELRSSSKPLVMADETIALLKEDIDVLQEQALAIRRDPSKFLDYSSHANALVLAPEERLEQMRGIIENFVCYIPKARTPPVSLRTAHISSPSDDAQEKQASAQIKSIIAPGLDLFHPAHVRTQTYFPDKRLIQFDCGKLQMLAVMLRQLKRDGHRCLIFTQMTRMLDVLEAFINLHGYTYLRLDGATKVEQRQKMMERFNHDRRVFLFILSTRSGGLGINLVGADTVIFYDTDWNPAMDAQAQDRCHRIGQTREVHIYRLISERTIEENILKKAKQKRQLDNIIKEGNFTTDFFKKVDIREMVKDGTSSSTMDVDGEGDVISAATSSSLNGSSNILIPGTAAAAEAQENENDNILDNPEMEAVLMEAEDAADVEALKAVRKEIAAERKMDDAEGGDDGDTPEWEAQLSAVHKMAMKYVELFNPSLDKNALASAHQQIADETANWKDEAVRRLKMGHELWHGDEPAGEDDEDDDDNDDDSEDDGNARQRTRRKNASKKRKRTQSEEDSEESDDENEDDQEDDDDEEEEDQNEEEEQEEGDEDEDQDDSDQESAEGDEEDGGDGSGAEEGPADEEDDEEDGKDEGAASAPKPTPKRTAGGRFTSSKPRRRQRGLGLNDSAMDIAKDGASVDNLPLFYEVDDMKAELSVLHHGSSIYDIPYGLEDFDQEEVYLPPSSQLPQLLDTLAETLLDAGARSSSDDDEDLFDTNTEGETTDFFDSPHSSPSGRRHLQHPDFVGDAWQFHDGSVRTFRSNQLCSDTQLRASDLMVSELEDASRHHLFLKPISEVPFYKERVEMEKNKLISATTSSPLYSNLMLARACQDESTSPSPALHLDTLKQLDPLCIATWTKEEDACILDTMREHWAAGKDEQSPPPIPWGLVFEALVPLAPPYTTRTHLQILTRWHDHLLPRQAAAKVRMDFDAGQGDFRISKSVGERLMQLLPPSHLVLPQEFQPLNHITPGVQLICSRIDAAMAVTNSTPSTYILALAEQFPTRQLADATASQRMVLSKLPDVSMLAQKPQTTPIKTGMVTIKSPAKEFCIEQSADPSLVFAAAQKHAQSTAPTKYHQYLSRVEGTKPGELPTYHPSSIVAAQAAAAAAQTAHNMSNLRSNATAPGVTLPGLTIPATNLMPAKVTSPYSNQLLRQPYGPTPQMLPPLGASIPSPLHHPSPPHVLNSPTSAPVVRIVSAPVGGGASAGAAPVTASRAVQNAQQQALNFQQSQAVAQTTSNQPSRAAVALSDMPLPPHDPTWSSITGIARGSGPADPKLYHPGVVMPNTAVPLSFGATVPPSTATATTAPPPAVTPKNAKVTLSTTPKGPVIRTQTAKQTAKAATATKLTAAQATATQTAYSAQQPLRQQQPQQQQPQRSQQMSYAPSQTPTQTAYQPQAGQTAQIQAQRQQYQQVPQNMQVQHAQQQQRAQMQTSNPGSHPQNATPASQQVQTYPQLQNPHAQADTRLMTAHPTVQMQGQQGVRQMPGAMPPTAATAKYAGQTTTQFSTTGPKRTAGAASAQQESTVMQSQAYMQTPYYQSQMHQTPHMQQQPQQSHQTQPQEHYYTSQTGGAMQHAPQAGQTQPPRAAKGTAATPAAMKQAAYNQHMVAKQSTSMPGATPLGGGGIPANAPPTAGGTASYAALSRSAGMVTQHQQTQPQHMQTTGQQAQYRQSAPQTQPQQHMTPQQQQQQQQAYQQAHYMQQQNQQPQMHPRHPQQQHPVHQQAPSNAHIHAGAPKTATAPPVHQLADRIVQMDPNTRATVQEVMSRAVSDQERYSILRNIYMSVEQRQRAAQPPRQ